MLFANYSNTAFEAGTDEAGRGCLAGPVTAAAILLPDNFYHPLLNDSKQVSEKNRKILRPILEAEAIDFKVIHLDQHTIDEINILNASIKAMQMSSIALQPTPTFIIVDGNRFKPLANIPHQTIIKGDAKYLSIAAASILAKTYRDEYMERIHEEFPMYHWNKNKGYPTQDHREAIRKYGSCVYHRQSFRLLPEQLKLEL
jgi:ribonuclease HII